MAKEKSFVEVLVNDPATVPEMILLNGFTGKSSLDGYTRLYLNAVLNEFYDIPNGAILHSQASAGAGALETSYVWVKADAELLRKGKSISDSKICFFTGPIQSEQAAKSGAAVNAGVTGVQNCTQAAEVCGHTAWQGCPAAQQ